MTPPNTGPEPDFAVDPEALENGIDDFLSPVIRKLEEISPGFTAAHAEVASAHASEGAGWFGGDGNGEVKSASSSFLNEVEYQLRWLAAEEAELTQSLRDYRTMLQQHAASSRETDNKIASGFRAIEDQLDGGR